MPHKVFPKNYGQIGSVAVLQPYQSKPLGCEL
jgi:hypothetical protein